MAAAVGPRVGGSGTGLAGAKRRDAEAVVIPSSASSAKPCSWSHLGKGEEAVQDWVPVFPASSLEKKEKGRTTACQKQPVFREAPTWLFLMKRLFYYHLC